MAMNITYENSDIPSDLAAEPIANAIAMDSTVWSIGIPKKDTLIAQEMMRRMGWVVYSLPETESVSHREDRVRTALSKLRGCINLPEGYDYKKDRAEYLESKYK